mgnify:CR=1 FL=1
MIITAIVQAIKSFFAAIGKVIAWLLTALGLWVPLLYSVIFLIVIAIAGIPIETTGTAYFLGLFVSLGLALWISMAVSARKNKTKKEKNVDYNVAEAKKKNRKSVPDENITVNSPQPVGSATQVTGDVLQSAVPPSQPQMQQGYIQQQNGYAQAYGQYPAQQPSYQQPMPPQQNYTQQQAMPAQNGFVPYTMPSQYPPQRPQRTGGGDRQARRLRRLLQPHPAPASGGHPPGQEDHYLRILRPHPRRRSRRNAGIETIRTAKRLPENRELFCF